VLNKKLQEKIKNNKNFDKPIVTSATIKTKNYASLKNNSIKLNIPTYQLAILCFEYFIKNHHSQLERKKGTVKYNKADDYSTMGIIYEDKEKFDFFRSFRIINLYSVSYLIDFAVEMYLSIVINILLQHIKNRKIISLDYFKKVILSIQNITINFTKKINSKHFVSFFYEFDFFKE